MKAQLIVISMLVSSICCGQTLSENDSVRFNKEKSEQLLNYKIQLENTSLDKKTPLDGTASLDYRADMILTQPSTSDIKAAIRKDYQGPMHEYLANPIGNPFADDYKYDAAYKITGRDWISTTSLHTTYPSLGSMSLIGVNYNYQFADRLTGSAGIYGTRYFYLMGLNYDFGANASLRYKVTDRFSVIGFGQYSARSNINKVGGDNAWMLPHTQYGVGGEYKITSKFGFQGGVVRQLNPMSGKWTTQPYLFPVIQLK